MDARQATRSVFTLVVVILTATAANAIRPNPACAAGYRTQYFIVTASTPEYAKEVAEAAERLRKELAIDWLGRELPPWRDSCPIEVVNDSGAGGVTQFYFDRGQPYGWSMRIQGTRDRVLDSVLPHEVTHMVFATHFGRPLPRWADEGACTTTEHVSERQKQERLLNTFLQSNRGIPFNAMFAMTEYPGDVLPLYAQGYSLTRFLISLEGRRRFIQFVGEGLNDRRWAAAVKRNYGFADLSDLQQQWNRWVAKGGHPQLAERFRSSSSGVAQLAAANTRVVDPIRVPAPTSAAPAAPPAAAPAAAAPPAAAPPAAAPAAISLVAASAAAAPSTGELAGVVPAAGAVALAASALPDASLPSAAVGARIASVPPTAPLVPVTYTTNQDDGGATQQVAFTPLSPITARNASSNAVLSKTSSFTSTESPAVRSEDPYAKMRGEYLREHPEEAARDPRLSKPVRQVSTNGSPKVILEWSRQPSSTVVR
jgi:pyruvate/2-oxoglutarate dehydrogenase complex dihydrolipoamide acyltransferase (E2) component